MTDLSVITRSHGHSQQVMAQRSKYVLRHVLRKDPTISYVEYLTNLSNESGHVHVADILKRISYESYENTSRISLQILHKTLSRPKWECAVVDVKALEDLVGGECL